MRFRQVLVDSGQIRPGRRNVCYVLGRERNVQCVLLTVLILGSATAVLLFCQISDQSTRQSSQCSFCCNDSTPLIPAAFIFTLYLLYLVECWHSKACQMISRRNKIDVNTVYWKLESMRRARPLVSWKALCFHFVNRAQHVSRMKDGKVYTYWKKVCERVNTHQVTCSFFAESCGWTDISRDLVELERHAVTQVHFHKNIIFANSIAREEFQRQRELFAQELIGLDDYIEISEELDLAGLTFPNTVTCWNQPDDLPWFARVRTFWILSSLLLSWPMRIILELNTAHVHYHVTKLFGTNYEPQIPRGSPSLSHSDPIQNQSCSWGSKLWPKQVQSSDNSEKQLMLWEESKSSVELKERAVFCDNVRNFVPDSLASVNNSPLPRSVTLLLPRPSYPFNVLVSSAHIGATRDSAVFVGDFSEIVPSYSEALLMCDAESENSLCQNSKIFNTARTEISSNVASRAKPSASLDQLAMRGLRNGGSNSQHTSWMHKSTSLGQMLPAVSFATVTDHSCSSYVDDSKGVELNAPPDYVQALETSLPVHIPFLTRVRRCQTERCIANKTTPRRLQDIRPTFHHHT